MVKMNGMEKKNSLFTMRGKINKYYDFSIVLTQLIFSLHMNHLYICNFLKMKYLYKCHPFKFGHHILVAGMSGLHFKANMFAIGT